MPTSHLLYRTNMAEPLAPVILVLSMIISLAIAVPLTGVLVRFRANYNPKGLQLDSEGGVPPRTGPVVHSYFGMFARVYRLEGWAGLYKGLMPATISTFIGTFVIGLALVTGHLDLGKYRVPEIGVLGTLFTSLAALIITLPITILTYRSITTPHKLTYFNLLAALRTLLTLTERRRPWILYLTPGLMAAETIRMCIAVLLVPFRGLFLSGILGLGLTPQNISIVKLTVHLVILGVWVLALTPLEVIMTRLAIQRNIAPSEYNSVPQEVQGDADEAVDYSGSEEDVIGLRNESDPYLGLFDCAKRIMNEEGWMTLYRAWWMTLLSGLGSALA